jgi:hypothetical protein
MLPSCDYDGCSREAITAWAFLGADDNEIAPRSNRCDDHNGMAIAELPARTIAVTIAMLTPHPTA